MFLHVWVGAKDACARRAGHFRRMGEMLKSGASARSELSASSSFTSSLNDPAGRAPSPARSPPSRRHSASHLPAAAAHGALGRPEVALCLLAEVAYEHDEPFRAHLPLLLHAMVVALDAREPLVAGHARAVVTHLLHALAARHVGPVAPGGPLHGAAAQVARTLRHLQAARGRRLWAAEDVTLARPRPPSAAALGALASEVVTAAVFEPDLRERWAAEALRWALEAASRHAAGRSLQVLSVLRPRATADSAAALVTALAACLSAGTPAALDHAAELVLTLQVCTRLGCLYRRC